MERLPLDELSAEKPATTSPQRRRDPHKKETRPPRKLDAGPSESSAKNAQNDEPPRKNSKLSAPAAHPSGEVLADKAPTAIASKSPPRKHGESEKPGNGSGSGGKSP